MVVGYVSLPVGVAGPLLLNGVTYQVPLATVEVRAVIIYRLTGQCRQPPRRPSPHLVSRGPVSLQLNNSRAHPSPAGRAHRLDQARVQGDHSVWWCIRRRTAPRHEPRARGKIARRSRGDRAEIARRSRRDCTEIAPRPAARPPLTPRRRRPAYPAGLLRGAGGARGATWTAPQQQPRFHVAGIPLAETSQWVYLWHVAKEGVSTPPTEPAPHIPKLRAPLSVKNKYKNKK